MQHEMQHDFCKCRKIKDIGAISAGSNPAALISDALYCINVYDDASRYYRNLITLIVMSAALVLASFLLIRRERYDSI